MKKWVCYKWYFCTIIKQRCLDDDFEYNDKSPKYIDCKKCSVYLEWKSNPSAFKEDNDIRLS